jgi:hypothetical protein
MGRAPVNLDSFKVASRLLFFIAVCKLQIWMELLYVSDDKYFMYESNTPLMIKKSAFSSGPVHFPKYFLCHPSHRIFGRMHGALNVGKKKLIVQFVCKGRDESFKPN